MVKTHCRAPKLSIALRYLRDRGQDAKLLLTGEMNLTVLILKSWEDAELVPKARLEYGRRDKPRMQPRAQQPLGCLSP